MFDYLLKNLFQKVLFARNPNGKFDEYEGTFVKFFEAKQNDPEFQQEFADCEAIELKDGNSSHLIYCTLASNELDCPVDAVIVRPSPNYISTHQDLPALNKFIIVFLGADDRYESNGALKDMALLAKITGAQVVGFNYSGIGCSATEDPDVRVNVFADMVNNGGAVVNFLLTQGASPDDVIMLGDSFGSATAQRVQEIFQTSKISLRLIAGNTFARFEDALQVSAGLPTWLYPKHAIAASLKRIGWETTTPNSYTTLSPYNYFLQREGDKTLGTASLRAHIDSRKEQYFPQDDLFDVVDESHPAGRLYAKTLVKLSQEHEQRLLSSGSGSGSSTSSDTHPLPLHYFAGALEAIRDYITYSNAYIQTHHQAAINPDSLPKFLSGEKPTRNSPC